MSDLIRRDDSLKEVYEAICTYYVGVKPLIEEIAEDVIHSALCNVPAVDAVPVRHGEWGFLYGTYGPMVCSECGGEAPSVLMGSEYEESQYCPTYGAKMDGKENNDE